MSDLELTWDQVSKLTEVLARKLALYFTEDNYIDIVAIPRGGVCIASMLAHHLSIRGEHLYTLQDIERHLPASGKLLLVDDISDTGNTMRRWYEQEKKQTQDRTVTVALVKRWNTEFPPDFFAWEIKTPDWIKFPWEVRQIPLSRGLLDADRSGPQDSSGSSTTLQSGEDRGDLVHRGPTSELPSGECD